jgi:hypothetical protein
MGDGAAFGRTLWRASYRVELPLAGQAERSKGENANNAAKADTYSETQFYRARCNIIGGHVVAGQCAARLGSSGQQKLSGRKRPLGTLTPTTNRSRSPRRAALHTIVPLTTV